MLPGIDITEAEMTDDSDEDSVIFSPPTGLVIQAERMNPAPEGVSISSNLSTNTPSFKMYYISSYRILYLFLNQSYSC